MSDRTFPIDVPAAPRRNDLYVVNFRAGLKAACNIDGDDELYPDTIAALRTGFDEIIGNANHVFATAFTVNAFWESVEDEPENPADEYEEFLTVYLFEGTGRWENADRALRAAIEADGSIQHLHYGFNAMYGIWNWVNLAE
jgi:hypothetical protein